MQASFPSAAWLTPDRATAWCRVLAVCEAAWLTAQFAAWPKRDLLPFDFACFWTASTLALHASPASVYDPATMAAVEHGLHAFADNLVQPFLYPPTYLLLCLPLALLPPGLAAFGFIVAGFAPFLLCLRRLLPWRWGWLPCLAFPGVLVTAGDGQNGLLTAACFGGGALLLDRFPFFAGLCLGLLTCKPHLAMLVPVGLLAAQRWRALAGAGVAALGLAGVSCLALGTQVWRVFPMALGEAQHVMFGSLAEPAQLQSVFGGALILHAPLWIGAIAQASISLIAALTLISVAQARPGGRAEGAALTIASLVASPYLMDYDLAVLAIPLAWLAAEAQNTGWRPWEKCTAVLAYMMPLLTFGIARRWGLPLAPLILIGLTAVVVRRAAVRRSRVVLQYGLGAENWIAAPSHARLSSLSGSPFQ